MLDDYGLHIASGMERDVLSVTAFTKNLAATIVKRNRHIKVLYEVKINNIEWEGRDSMSSRVFQINEKYQNICVS